MQLLELHQRRELNRLVDYEQTFVMHTNPPYIIALFILKCKYFPLMLCTILFLL
jgi:hypothetical protein